MPKNSSTSRSERRRQERSTQRERVRQERLKRPLTFDAGAAWWWPPVAVALVALVVLVAIGGPGNLLADRLPFGADQTTHNWWLLEFRDRITAGRSPLGWSDGMSTGYLFGYFYFPVPPLVVSVLGVLVPAAVSIKLMVYAAVITVPVGIWRLAKGVGLGHGAQAAAVLASSAFLLAGHALIVGGTVFATYVGEFSYAMGLGLGLWAVGETLRLTRDEGRWQLAGILAALSVMSHVQAAVFCGLAGVVLLAFRLRSRSAGLAVGKVALVAAGLSAGWWLATVSLLDEANGIGLEPRPDIWFWFFNSRTAALTVVGLTGLAVGTLRRRAGAGELLTATAVCMLVVLIPSQLTATGRGVPVASALCAFGLVYGAEAVLHLVRMVPGSVARTAAAGALATTLALAVAVPLSSYDNRVTQMDVTRRANQGWPAVPAAATIAELEATLASLPPGRAFVETPMNFAQTTGIDSWYGELPLTTGGNVTSPLALFAEASRTTPGIEHTYGNLSIKPRLSDWRVAPPDAALVKDGIAQARALGVRYYIFTSPIIKQLVLATEGVRLVATVGERDGQSLAAQADTDSFSGASSGVYYVYEIDDADLVTAAGPVTPVPSFAGSGAGAAAYLDAVAADPATPMPVEDLPEDLAVTAPVQVSNVEAGRFDEQVSFDVDRPGVPVVVRMSYSGQWVATGAQGPFRTATNQMVVIPESTQVTLAFEQPTSQAIGLWLTFATAVFLLGSGAHAAARRISRRHRPVGGPGASGQPTGSQDAQGPAAQDHTGT